MPHDPDEYKESLGKLELIHDEHLVQKKSDLNSLIMSLENELHHSRSEVKQKESLLKQYKSNMKVPTINTSLMDVLNSTNELNIVDETFHQKVVFRLENQLSDMRHQWIQEDENIRKECSQDLLHQKLQYEKYLAEIKQCYEEEKSLLDERIKNLQGNPVKSVDSSFISDVNVSREVSMLHLTEQLILVTEKYSDLRVQSNIDIAEIKTANSNLHQKIKSLNQQIKKLKTSTDSSQKDHKEEIDSYTAKIKSIEKNFKESDTKIKEFSELRKQVTRLRNDMVKSDRTEIKVREAIKKKKDEHDIEKYTGMPSKVVFESYKMILDNKSKLEKELKTITKKQSIIIGENKILKKRINNLLVNREIVPAYYNTTSHSNRNSSIGHSLKLKFSPISEWGIENSIARKSSMGSLSLKGHTYDARTNSYKEMSSLNVHAKGKGNTPIGKKWFSLISGSSLISREKKGSLCKDHVDGENESGSCRYCECCKYRFWNKKLLSYDPDDLINNRDLIKHIKCLAWEENYEVIQFIHHSKTCRLTKGVPNFMPKKKSSLKNEHLSSDHMENSSSSLQKELFGESNILYHSNKELIFNLEEDIIPNSPPTTPNLNESEVISKIYYTGVDEKSNDSVTKLMALNHTKKPATRRMTETKESSKMKILKRRTGVKLDTEDILFDAEKSTAKTHVKEIISTINDFETNENFTFNGKPMLDSMTKASFSTAKNASRSDLKQKFKLFTAKVPSLKKYDKVLKHTSSK
jgi:hypothetical protein